MMHNRLNSVPATALETMADTLNMQPEPINIRSTGDHVALATDALWRLACKTGLNRESERIDTVITDFLANLLHLCEQTDPEGDVYGRFNALLTTAMMHYEQEKTGDDSELL